MAVSKFYIRIRHELRRRYGYTRAVTAIHATQVYHLLDKTFREAADIDVIKALPKNEADRRAVARLIAPEYVPAVFSLLRRLGRQRLLARTLAEFLEAVYTAVVVMDGTPYVVRAFHDGSRIAEEVEEKKRWLRKVQHMALGPEEEQGANTNAQTWALRELLELILKNAELRKWNNRSCKLVLPSQVFPSKRLVRALAELGILSAEKCLS